MEEQLEPVVAARLPAREEVVLRDLVRLVAEPIEFTVSASRVGLEGWATIISVVTDGRSGFAQASLHDLGYVGLNAVHDRRWSSR
jgi:hypothetical protein